MRTTLALIVLMVTLALPASAQFRETVPGAPASSRLYNATGAAGSVLNKIFHPSVFQMSHSFEMSAGSFGGRGYSMGMYTNSLAWQFNDKLAARVDVSVAYSPVHKAATALGFQDNKPKVFLRNADIAWRPSKKFQLHLQVRQNPYGSYMHPYGPGRYGYGYGRDMYLEAGFGGHSRNLFWR